MSRHLKGHFHRTHTDKGVLSWIKEEFGIQTMLDVGCGPGGMEKDAKSLDIEWTGIDGDPSLKKENIITHDFTKGDVYSSKCDLVWCVEFVEHVDEEFVPNFVPSLCRGEMLVLTAAPPGKAGHHHVNCKRKKYWIELLTDVGLTYSKSLTETMRKKSTMKRNFIRERGMFFFNQAAPPKA